MVGKFFKVTSLLVAAVTLVGLTACASEPAPSDDTAKLQKVSLGVTGLNAFHLWVIAARDEKLMEPAGIDLDLVTFSGFTQVMPALVSGSLQFALAPAEQAMAAHLQEPDLKMVIGSLVGSPFSLIGGPDIHSLKDLKGKTISVNAVGATADYNTAKAMLTDAGLKEGVDYNFITGGATSQRVAAMNAGVVDAVLLNEPDVSTFLESGKGNVLAKGTDLPRFSNSLAIAVVSNQSWYSENEELAAKFARGYQDTMKWMFDPANKEKAVADFARQFKVSNELAEKTYDTFINGVIADIDQSGAIDQANITQTLENALENGIKSVSGIEPKSLSEFYDNSLVEAAAKIRE